MKKILLFYKYVAIEYPKQVVKWQKKLCQELGLKGRIFIAKEGINGTLCGSTEKVAIYTQAMNKHNLFNDIDFKESDTTTDGFPRLYIVERKEIVHLGIAPTILPATQGGTHLKPEQVHQLLDQHPDDLVVLDARNDYEWRIGKFEQAITPPISTFKEFPAYIDKHIDQFRDKQVLMYCTGGVRCERATAYLKQKNVAAHVYQLEGGIHRYTEQYPNGHFKGKNYVFDDRIALPITGDVLSTCDLCSSASDDYTNCLNASCNNHFIACQGCLVTYTNCCSNRCKELLESKQVKPRPDYNKKLLACSIANT